MAENNKGDTIEIPIGKYVSLIKKNPWATFSVVLFIVLILFIVFGSGAGAGSVSKNKAANNLISYVNGLGQGTAELTSVVKEGALYKVTVKFNGQDVPVYVTLDGKYLIQQPVPLTGGSTTTDDQNTATLKISDLNLSNYLSIGNQSAKVTVVEFSDFSCPFCQAASGENPTMVNYMKQNDATWEPIVTNLMKDYVNTGKVRFVYIYSMGHSGGHPASLVAWCLNDQNPNFFKPFYEGAFALEGDKEVENLTRMIALAKTINGVNANTLQQCLDSKKYDSRFAAEQAIATQVGAQGTPAFFVNDEYVAHGAQSYVQFKQAIDAALAQ